MQATALAFDSNLHFDSERTAGAVDGEDGTGAGWKPCTNGDSCDGQALLILIQKRQQELSTGEDGTGAGWKPCTNGDSCEGHAF